MRECLDRIEAREGTVQAWEAIDPDYALEQARRVDPHSLLQGLPIGVKDIIDTADFATGYGSPIYRGHRPQSDAACVQALRAGGAVLVGKTVTTAFACGATNVSTNPRDAARTPGGSSSGSAAAVGAGMLPVALGTQSQGSILRPAAYCGVVGVKHPRSGCRLCSGSSGNRRTGGRGRVAGGGADGRLADRQGTGGRLRQSVLQCRN